MRTRLLLLAVLITFCYQPVTKGFVRQHSECPQTDSVTKALNEPNIDTMRKQLFSFFESHKNLDSFYMEDDRYLLYWGPGVYVPYSITAGHLFNKSQVHALITYADDRNAGILIYLKQNGHWIKLLEDTTMSYSQRPQLIDWNADGIKDLSISVVTSAGTSAHYYLWLIDKNGKKTHPVKGFENIPNPQLQKRTGYINSSEFHNCSTDHAIYVFKNYNLVKLYEVATNCCIGISSLDSECEITCFKGKLMYKDIYTKRDSVSKYVPAEYKKDTRGFYN